MATLSNKYGKPPFPMVQIVDTTPAHSYPDPLNAVLLLQGGLTKEQKAEGFPSPPGRFPPPHRRYQESDAHREKAAEVFDIPLEEVTDTQRKHAKSVSFADHYSPTGDAGKQAV